MSDTDLDLEQFRQRLATGARIAGLDLGSKTIGIALSDPTLTVASPLQTIRRSKFTRDAAALKDILATHEVGGIVLGLPINMDGSHGPRVQATRAFARNIDPLIGLPLTFWDERLSTAAVTRTLIDADQSRKRRAEVVDKMAAAYILQGFLDRLMTLD